MKRKIVSLIVSIAGLFVFAQLSMADVQAASFTFYGILTTVPCNAQGTDTGAANQLIQIIAHGDGSHAPYQNYYAVTDSEGYFSAEIAYVGEPGLHYHAFPPSGWADIFFYEGDYGLCWAPGY